MNAFVAGKVDEVKTLGTILLDAADAVDQSIRGNNVEIQYKDGHVIISYEPIIK